MIDLKKFNGIIPQSKIKDIYDYSIKLDFSTGGSKCYQISRSDKTLIINVNNLPLKEKKILKAIIIDSIDNDKAILIANSRTELLDKLYKYNDSNDNQILSFFKPILSNKDWETLRDSLFLRNEFKKHININNLKLDIKTRYGERGNTISNLCTAGYFEEVMIPLFNSSQTDFWNYYDLSLDMGITALFVNDKMKINEIRDEIKRRLHLGKEYGLQNIHIHGIGKKNIKNIKDCIEKEKSSLNFTEKHLFTDKSLNVLVVELIL